MSEYIEIINAELIGIPVKLGITDFDAGEPACRTGHPDNWTPGEGPWIAFDLLDEYGEQADADLLELLTEEDQERLEQEAINHLLQETP
jgi:hypothetical protein